MFLFCFFSGAFIKNASFNTHEDSNSGNLMATFLSTLPDEVIILVVVYYRGNVHYSHAAAASLSVVCPHAPSILQENQSNGLICFKGFDKPSWMESNISTYSQGPAIVDKDIFLPTGKKYNHLHVESLPTGKKYNHVHVEPLPFRSVS